MNWKDLVKDLGFKEGVLVGVLLVIVLAILAALFGLGIDTTKAPTWWQLMTAFGTVGAVIVAVGAMTWSEHRGRRQKRSDGVLAVYAQAKELDRVESILNDCADQVEVGGAGAEVHGRTTMEWLAVCHDILEKKIRPQYADYDGEFVRAILDAKESIDEANWLGVTGKEDSEKMAAFLKSAIENVRAAADVSKKARKDMEQCWA